MKKESGNCFCIRVVQSIKLRLIVMPTNFENRARERQRKGESRRQASEAQREKSDRDLEREIKPKRKFFFSWKNNMEIFNVAAVRK